MFKVKNMNVFTYNDKYIKDIQLQFLNDAKFTEFMEELCNSGSNFQQTLATYTESFNLTTQTTNPNTATLNAIGGLLGLPPIDYFTVNGAGISQETYLMIIKGQQLKNAWDGTNAGLINSLTQLFPEYGWDIYDTGEMGITIYMIQRLVPIDSTVQYLFENGWFTPKPAGIQVSYNTVTTPLFTWDSNATDTTWDSGTWA